MNAFRAALLGCSFLLVALAPPAGNPDQDFATSFCPECWKFLKAPEASDRDGTCRTCGKLAVAVDASELTWYWCVEHEFWHRFPCEAKRYRKNWHPRTAIALVVSPGDERLRKAAYCPECRTLPPPLKTERMTCPACGGRLTGVDVADLEWFWCKHDMAWKAEPCPENMASQCCTPRSGTLMAKQRLFRLGTIEGGGR